MDEKISKFNSDPEPESRQAETQYGAGPEEAKKAYPGEAEEPSQEGPPEKIEVPPEVRERLEIIARVVGGDFGMKIEIADRPGIGSGFNSHEVKITFDPQQVIESPEQAEFVAAHEGGHRAISRSPDQIGVKDKKIIELCSSPGFGFLVRSIEEPADNEWVGRKFEGIKKTMKETISRERNYDSDDPPVILDPEVLGSVALLGYTPKFVYYGPQLERWWLKGEFSKNLDPEVRAVLEKTIKAAERAYLSLPSLYPTERQVLESAKKRFLICYRDIWPEFQKLVEEDISQEKIRQMIEDEMKKACQNIKESLDRGDPLPGSLGELSEDLQKELREKMKQGLENMEKILEEAKELEAEKPKERKEERPSKPKTAEEELFEAPEEGEKDEGEKEEAPPQVVPLPFPELSDKLKEALKNVFEDLPQTQKEKYQKEARETIENLEDQASQALDPKLQETHAPLHQELKELKKAKEKAKETELSETEKREIEERELERLRKELERIEQEKLSFYDKYYQEVSHLIEDLYQRLQRIIRPTKGVRWQPGFPTGQRLSLKKAMQYEAEKGKYKELWERKTLPEKRDFRVVILIDLSSSMFDGRAQKIQETFKGLVVIEEVLNRLNIESEIIGFTDTLPNSVGVFKPFDQELSDKVREKIGKVFHVKMGGTPTGTATRFASRELGESPRKYNYLITLTDGEPYPSYEATLAKEVIQKIREDTDQRLIGIGLGPGTGHVKDYYPAWVVAENIEEFPDQFADLMEDIIANPEKYK